MALKKGIQKVRVVGGEETPVMAKEEKGMRVNLHWPEDHKGLQFNTLSLGKTVNVTLRGKITGLDMQQYGSSLNLLVPFKHVTLKQGVGGDIKQLKSQRVVNN